MLWMTKLEGLRAGGWKSGLGRMICNLLLILREVTRRLDYFLIVIPFCALWSLKYQGKGSLHVPLISRENQHIEECYRWALALRENGGLAL